MKKSARIAGVICLVMSMSLGNVALAAPSSTTRNTETRVVTQTVYVPVRETPSSSSSYVKSQDVYSPNNIVITREKASGGIATIVGNASTGGAIRIYADYSSVTNGRAVSTAVVARNDKATSSLKNYIRDKYGAVSSFGPFKLRMYDAGVAIWDGFGTFTASFGIGNQFDGREVIVFQIHKDGSISERRVTVAQGKVSVSVTDMGTFIIAFA